MKANRIFDIKARVMADGGADLSCRVDYRPSADCAKTAVAKLMMAINQYCDHRELGIYLEIHDVMTGKALKVSFQDDPK